jgi:hypothetical protein
LESFLKYNTYPIDEYIIVEDSTQTLINDFVKDIIKDVNVNLIYNQKNIGQLESIDKAYGLVKTDYIFHCEDDWEFIDYSFIEKSFEILAKDEKIYTVWLRSHNDTSAHPIIKKDLGRYYKMDPNFSYVHENKKYTWCGVTFNPGLRRTKTCMIFHPYCSIQERDNPKYVGEYDVNNVYKINGYYGVITTNSRGYVKHIGWNEHIKRPWE